MPNVHAILDITDGTDFRLPRTDLPPDLYDVRRITLSVVKGQVIIHFQVDDPCDVEIDWRDV